MTSEEVLWNKLEQDDFLKVFLQGKYDVQLHEQISVGLAVSEQLAKLTEGISLLDKELQTQVTDHYEDLLSQATCIEKLEGVLGVMQTHIQGLLTAVERLRSKIVEPYNKVQTQTLMLTRLHATCDLLRRVIRISQLSKRLSTQMQSGATEITKAAQSLNELEEMAKDVDLSGLEVIEEDQRMIKQHRVEVERQARQLLAQGLANHNESQVETAIQVFHNLGTLRSTVEHSLSAAKQRISKSAKEELDVHNLTQPTPVQQSRSKGKKPSRLKLLVKGKGWRKPARALPQ